MVIILKSPNGYRRQLLFIFNWVYGYLRLKKRAIISIKKLHKYEWGEYVYFDKRDDDYGLTKYAPCHFITINSDIFKYNNKTMAENNDIIISATRVMIHEMYHAYQNENKILSLPEFTATASEIKIWNQMRKELLSIIDFVG